jgi:hypothetical protein
MGSYIGCILGLCCNEPSTLYVFWVRRGRPGLGNITVIPEEDHEYTLSVFVDNVNPLGLSVSTHIPRLLPGQFTAKTLDHEWKDTSAKNVGHAEANVDRQEREENTDSRKMLRRYLSE